MRSLVMAGMVVIAAATLAVDGASAQARQVQAQTKSYFFKEAGADIEYAIFVPSGYRPGVPSPLIVALHGNGSNPREIILTLINQAEARNVIVVAPMGFNDHGGYGARGPGRGRTADPGDPENLGELSERDVMNVLAIVREEYSIDPARVYLMGHSMGGGGVFYLGTKYPEIWAALAAVAPSTSSTEQPLEKLGTTPVLLIHGTADEVVNIRVSLRLVRQLKTLGVPFRFIQVAGGDHIRVIARNAKNVQTIFDFFEAARRDDR
jgi:poly(3-hydroxybutyrate) depolymerase